MIAKQIQCRRITTMLYINRWPRIIEHSGQLTKILHWHSFLLHTVLTNFSSSKFIRCYHAQTDGWDSTTFHSKCNGKGSAVSIIQVDNYTFGGYTDVSWQSMHFQLVINYSLQRRWLGKQYPSFGAKICADSCPPTSSVPRCSQFPQSEARGKL